MIHEKLALRNEEFNVLFNELVIPIRFGILALISAYKCTIFEDNIIELMKQISALEFQGHKNICKRKMQIQENLGNDDYLKNDDTL